MSYSILLTNHGVSCNDSINGVSFDLNTTSIFVRHCLANQFSQSFGDVVNEKESSRLSTCSVLARGTFSAPLPFQSICRKF